MSSFGLYDFLYAYPDIQPQVRERIVMISTSVTDYNINLLSVKILLFFMPKTLYLNCIPYHNSLQFINKELIEIHHGKKLYNGKLQDYKYKTSEIEGFTKFLGVAWSHSYINKTYFARNQVDYFKKNCKEKICTKSYFIAGKYDGIWKVNNKSMNTLLEQFCCNYTYFIDDSTHIFINAHEYLLVTLQKIFKEEKLL